MPSPLPSRFLPILEWGPNYTADKFSKDTLAAVIVALMLIPQSLAYALLAGLPAEMGLYASIFGLLVYGLFGSSSSLSVGPVAIISLMTAAALAKLAPDNAADYIAAAMTLAALSGAMLLLLGIFRLGYAANFLSIPVIAAFITAAAIIIAAGQLPALLGVSASGHTLIEIAAALRTSVTEFHWPTLLIAILSITLLWWARSGLSILLRKMGLAEKATALLAKAGPILALLITGVIAYVLRLDEKGVALVGDVSLQIPDFGLPNLSLPLVTSLLAPAALIAIIGFVESISVAQTLAAKKRQQVEPDQELISLGAANLAVAMSGGFPVTGGISRSIVNFDAGAETPAAGIFTAVFIAVVAIIFAPFIYWLPKVSLAVTIIFAVITLIDFSMLRKAWVFSRADFVAMLVTGLLTLTMGVEIGIAAGVLVSMLIILYKMSRPHVAVVGRVSGTEHFRNIERHNVQTYKNILSVRIDESLYFFNTRYLEHLIYGLVAKNTQLEHVILMCTAVNKIDMSALETLLRINQTLHELKVRMHMSEIKGPVMDALQRTEFFSELTGNCYLSQNQAVESLKVEHMPLSGL